MHIKKNGSGYIIECSKLAASLLTLAAFGLLVWNTANTIIFTNGVKPVVEKVEKVEKSVDEITDRLNEHEKSQNLYLGSIDGKLTQIRDYMMARGYK